METPCNGTYGPYNCGFNCNHNTPGDRDRVWRARSMGRWLARTPPQRGLRLGLHPGAGEIKTGVPGDPNSCVVLWQGLACARGFLRV